MYVCICVCVHSNYMTFPLLEYIHVECIIFSTTTVNNSLPAENVFVFVSEKADVTSPAPFLAST